MRITASYMPFYFLCPCQRSAWSLLFTSLVQSTVLLPTCSSLPSEPGSSLCMVQVFLWTFSGRKGHLSHQHGAGMGLAIPLCFAYFDRPGIQKQNISHFTLQPPMWTLADVHVAPHT